MPVYFERIRCHRCDSRLSLLRCPSETDLVVEVRSAAVDQVGRPAVRQDGRRGKRLVVQLLQIGGRPRRPHHRRRRRRVGHSKRGSARSRHRRGRRGGRVGSAEIGALQLGLDAPQGLDVLRAPLSPEAAAAQPLGLVLQLLSLGLVVQGILKGRRGGRRKINKLFMVSK